MRRSTQEHCWSLSSAKSCVSSVSYTHLPNTTVGFNKDVTLENGIYFNESFQEEAEVEQLLSGVQQAEKRCV